MWSPLASLCGDQAVQMGIMRFASTTITVDMITPHQNSTIHPDVHPRSFINDSREKQRSRSRRFLHHLTPPIQRLQLTDLHVSPPKSPITKTPSTTLHPTRHHLFNPSYFLSSPGTTQTPYPLSLFHLNLSPSWQLLQLRALQWRLLRSNPTPVTLRLLSYSTKTVTEDIISSVEKTTPL